jgi:serine/threonine-protein kinase
MGPGPERFEERYASGEELGRGGVGRVFAAEDRLMRRMVAIKALHEGRAAEVQTRRFFAEAQTTAQLEHPNVVPVYDMGSLPDGEPFFSMKWVRGRALSEMVAAYDGADRQARFRLLQIFTQVCMAVDYAHSKGVIHRDLKPDNVMVGDFGEVLVMDWGIAKTGILVEEDEEVIETSVDHLSLQSENEPMTVEGAIVGTPGYMPPEQAIGDLASIDARSDVWALGAILYEILTGRRTFSGASAFSVLIATASEDVMPPKERAPGRDIPDDLQDISLRALR